MFKINFKYLINLLLPTILRKDKQISWLELITSQLRKIYDEYQLFKLKWLLEVNFTTQVCYLEKKLQQLDSQIVIEDGQAINSIFLFNTVEPHLPIYISNEIDNCSMAIINLSEINQQCDFVIKTSNLYLSEKINAIVNKYKLYEKQYLIIQNNE